MSDSDSEYDITGAIASIRENGATQYSSASDSDGDLDDARLSDRAVQPTSSGKKSKTSTARRNNLTPSGQSRFVEDSDDDDEESFFRNLPSTLGTLPVDGSKKKVAQGIFASLGLSSRLVKAVNRKGYKIPTPIQRKTIPLVLGGMDVVGMARTGSGKTAAFVLPMIDRLKVHSAKVGARAVILSPSRELALQTVKVVKEFSRGTDLKSVLLVGGDSLDDQFGLMMSNPDIIVATPGRFAHLQVEMSLDLHSVEYIVFDEADRLFEMGFAMQLTSIVASLPATRQTLLFSATLPKSLVEFARAGLTEPVLVRLDTDAKVSDALQMYFFSTKSGEIDGSLIWILRHVIKMPLLADMSKSQTAWTQEESEESEADNDNEGSEGKRLRSKFTKGKKGKKLFLSRVPQGNELTSANATIVFTPTRHHVEYVANLLRGFGYAVSHIYGSLDQRARLEQLAKFRAGATSILVVTDVAARGIDIPILANVINYSFPGSPKIFVHRVGRTARAGKSGHAYSLVTETEVPYLLDLELFLGKKLLLSSQLKQVPLDQIDYTSNIIVGSLPRDDLERACEDVQNHVTNDYDLKLLVQVAQKSEKLYMKSRGSASSESVKRAKEVTSTGGWGVLFPLFREQKVAEREDMLLRLSKFRPSETIFELTRKGGVSVESGAELMKQRRQQIAPIVLHAKRNREQVNEVDESGERDTNTDGVNGMDEDSENREHAAALATEDDILSTFKLESATKRKRSSDDKQAAVDAFPVPSKKRTKISFRDDAHYISHYAAADIAEDRGYGINKSAAGSVVSFMEGAGAASFDLVGDESGLQQSNIIGGSRNKITKWDKKKKKYVTQFAGDDTDLGGKRGKMIRAENGVKLPATYKSGKFEEWKKAHKKSGLRVGEAENSGPGNNRKYRHNDVKAPKAADKFRDDYKSHVKRYKEAQAKGLVQGADRSELKTSAQMHKLRALKQKRKEKNARPSRKKK
ncbi:P-loop containing nucleoside triphosphate hydrolase protein [Limtongia smithiae]|uniref:P-loop containing nucleoside triphosphate hydrolase protein n=1 Tax=Limtongia smithiae TaxID=1125753 RepID=UPI0034CF5C05